MHVGGEIVSAASMATGQELGREISGMIGQPGTELGPVIAAPIAAAQQVG